MAEGFALAMDISQEVLGALGQSHDSLEVYNLCRSIGNRGERLREQLQIVEVGVITGKVFHIFKWFIRLVRSLIVSLSSSGSMGM